MADDMNKDKDPGAPDKGDKKDMTVERAGHMGGQKVKKLVEEGKEFEDEKGRSDPEDMAA